MEVIAEFAVNAVVNVLLVIIGIHILARLDVFFTLVREGTAKVIVIAGKPIKVFLTSRNSRVTGRGDGYSRWEIEDGSPKLSLRRKLWEKVFGGIYFYAWPIAQVYNYPFTWTTIKRLPSKDDQESREIRETRTQKISWIYVKDYVYAIVLKNVELSDKIPIEIVVLLTISVKNPIKALFAISNWLESITDLVGAEMIQILAGVEYDNLISEKSSIRDQLQQVIREKMPEIFETYGVEIKRAELKDIEPPEEFRDLTLIATRKRKEADGVREEARGVSDRSRIEAEGQALAITTVTNAVRDGGDVAMDLQRLKTLGETKPSITVVSPNILDAVKNVFGGRRI